MRQVLAMLALGAVVGLAPVAALADDNSQGNLPTTLSSSNVDVTSTDNGNGAQQLDPSDGVPAYLQAPVYLQNNQ
ncbi:MAG TPA: hypothetical protein VKZ50_17345 [bacterium]|nr:hypothetical protein [bacterium]